ncbi:SIR2 family protein [Paenibacillus lentus]|uniref:SIR2 family protein n=1 Tax=Paenibacillus lentus TaxID=1338368 RepID=UPI0013DDD7B3|nr:SIR2 family protein [Paenibacillus lentus]
MVSDKLNIELDAFIRSVSINKSSPHSLLIGAGASITSGIPSASNCIWQWKRDIFLTKNQGLGDQFNNITLPHIQQRIQEWLDYEGEYPESGADEEYSFYIEKCYPIPRDRRRYFQSIIENKKPYIGYQLLALLAGAGVVQSVWTTNFDGLVAKAALNSALVTPIEVGLDSIDRIERIYTRGELLCVSLHGDYRYDALKNTENELQVQDRKLRLALINHLKTHNLIVSGYSGRDHSVMAALEEAYSYSGEGRLYWCGVEESEPNEVVSRLIKKARENGREAYFISTSGFDDLMSRLATHCLESVWNDKVNELTKEFSLNKVSPSFSIDSTKIGSIVKSNVFPIDIPTEVLQFSAPLLKGAGTWQKVMELINKKNVVAVPFKGQILALGLVDELRDVFREYVDSEIVRTPISSRELSYEDGVIISLLTSALVKSVVQSNTHLCTDGRNLIWDSTVSHQERIQGQYFNVHEGVLLYIRQIKGKHYVILKPTIKGSTINGEELSVEVSKELKRSVLQKQYNQKFNAALMKWRSKIISEKSVRSYDFPAGCGSTFKFHIKPAPLYAKLTSSSGRNEITVPPSMEKYISLSGMHFNEPKLLFSSHSGQAGVKETHPIRGVLHNRPYDFSITQSAVAREITIGVICPEADSGKVSSYFGNIHMRRKPETNTEYLMEFPGFMQAFGTAIDIPQPNQNNWFYCDEPTKFMDQKHGAIELARHICDALDRLNINSAPNVVVIYIPARWRIWEKYNDIGERFDLHDYIKAYCIQRGIATQFLREETLRKPQQCQIMWWLSLSFYVKAGRTPWILDSLDRDTAFMGIGYSVDTSASKGNQIILGCSHLYSSNGLGLRYKLSKIEEPIFRGKNPYMSQNDARRMGESVRQLFYESLSRLPRRVVIHKRTPFQKEEKEGLLQGLAGIENIDMIEINIESAQRYVSSVMKHDGTFVEDGFPIRRATSIILENQKALLWVHGTTEAIISNRKYYQGKSRIPAPLVIKRHHGNSSLSTIAREILGLSKMNWNTFDLYTKLPATIQSSNEIAKIGSLLERFGPMSYDYRLFI